MADKNIINSEFGARLKQLMSENGETIYTVAPVVNLSPSTISRYVNGSMSPKIPTVKILAHHFKVNPSWLMGFAQQRMEITPVEKKIDAEIKALYQLLDSSSKQTLLCFIRKLIQQQ